MFKVKVTGQKEVIANIRKKGKEYAAGVERGVKAAGLELQRQSQRLVPVDFGNLKASAFTQVAGSGFGTRASVGYSAFYALYVHEAAMVLKGQPRPGGRGRYWDPQGRAQAKFLEEPARRFGPTYRRIVQEHARVKKK